LKIGIFGIEGFSTGKGNVVDERIDTLKDMFKSAKKVFIQADIITESEKLKEADGIVCPEKGKFDLIVGDLEFVETRLERTEDPVEKELFNRFKPMLEKEELLAGVALNEAEKKIIQGYPLLTMKPLFLVKSEDLENKEKILFSSYYGFGYISFFTAGEKDSRAWSVKKGATAWEAAGCIHSDIQKGFIRAEVMSYADLMSAGDYNQARANNHLRLENKEYIVQDGDLVNFRFSK
jgi:hypothetical protein